MRTPPGSLRHLAFDLPIIQAPMAGVQDHRLAAAVCEAGALGSLPAAMYSLDALRSELSQLKSKTSRPFNINFFCHPAPAPDPAREARWRAALLPYYRELGIDESAIPDGAGRKAFDDETADVVEAFRPAVVSFHFGLPPQPLLDRVKGWGAVVLSSATSVEEAVWLEQHGVDAVIFQGTEAGGHRGSFLEKGKQGRTFDLLPRVVDAVSVPVIATGGIADRHAVSHALSLGATAAQVGTAFLLCPEATTSAVHRAALSAALTNEMAPTTALTNLFSGRPARGIVNRLMRDLGPMSDLPPAFPLASAALAPLRAAAERAGRGDFSPLWAGENISGCAVIPAAELTRQLADGLKRPAEPHSR